jgi:hypothetical protein
MSRPHLPPPLAPETLAALAAGEAWLAPRHTVGAVAHPALVTLLTELRDAENDLRRMKALKDEGAEITLGSQARRAKRANDAFAAVFRVAHEAGDEAFTRQVEIISAGLGSRPLRVAVFIAWTHCSTAGRKLSEADLEAVMLTGECQPESYTPTAGEVAEVVQGTRPELVTPRDITNHLKALVLPYAAARRGGRKSI